MPSGTKYTKCQKILHRTNGLNGILNTQNSASAGLFLQNCKLLLLNENANTTFGDNMFTKIKTALIIVMIIGNFLAYPLLPGVLPTHWNFQGIVNSTMPKQFAVWLLPGMALLIWLLFHFLPQLDPKKNNYKLFQVEWQMIQITLISFITYLHFVIFYIGLNPDISFLPFMFVGLGVLFILLGNYMSKIRQNYFIGIRVPWTLASEENWNKTHRFASRCFVTTGIIILVEAFLIWNAPVLIFTGILLSAFLPIVYSFLLFKKQTQRMKYVYIGLIAIAVIVIVARLITPEVIITSY